MPRFVFASTNLVYRPGYGRPAREDDSLQPTQAYPEGKATAERALLELHHTRRLGLRIMRLAFVYGEGDPHLTELVGQFRTWHPARRLHMVHHADVAQALMLALDTPEIDGRIYNVADDEPITSAEILRLLDEPNAQEAEPLPLDNPWEGIVDTSRIRNELGFRPRYPSLRTAREAGAL